MPPASVAATKADKLSGNGRAASRAKLRAELGVEPLLVSAETGLGIPELWRRLERAIEEWEAKATVTAGADTGTAVYRFNAGQ